MKMKSLKNVLGLVAIGAISLGFNPSVVKAECLSEANEASVASVKNGEATEYCTTLSEALNNAKNNGVVTLLKDIVKETAENGYESRNTSEASTFTFDLNNHIININDTVKPSLMIEDGSTVTIKDSGSEGAIKSETGKAALKVSKGHLILNGGSYVAKNEKSAAIIVGSNGNETSIVVNKASISSEYNGITAQYGTHLTYNGGEINAKYFGITVWDTGTIVEFKGGKINAQCAIAGNGAETINSKITISGGELNATNAAIYYPNTTELKISGGTITGAYGVVARQGIIDITGGTIIAKGSGSTSMGDAKDSDGNLVQLPMGTAVVIDNVANYHKGVEENKAKVNISGGIFKTDNSLIYERGLEDSVNSTYAKVSGGQFDKKVSSQFVVGKNAEVEIAGTYYVGSDAENAVLRTQANTIINVLQGDLVLSDVNAGVIITNKGKGVVVINGTVVAENQTVYITKVEEKDEDQEASNTVIVDNVEFEDNGDGIVIEGKVVNVIDEVYDAMRSVAQEKGYSKIFKMYDFWLKDDVSIINPVKITFTLGNEYNGKNALILHQKHDGSYQEVETVVENGKISITVSELSPFIVVLKDEVAQQPSTEKPETGSNNAQTSAMSVGLYGLLFGATLLGAGYVIRKNEG